MLWVKKTILVPINLSLILKALLINTHMARTVSAKKRQVFYSSAVSYRYCILERISTGSHFVWPASTDIRLNCLEYLGYIKLHKTQVSISTRDSKLWTPAPNLAQTELSYCEPIRGFVWINTWSCFVTQNVFLAKTVVYTAYIHLEDTEIRLPWER
jgi:hypothetical protein